MLLSKHLSARSLLLAIGCCVSFTAAADVCRVTEQGKADKNGSDWGANATTLQAALKNSHSKNCDEIWVKAGVYKPTSNNDTSISFVIERELQLYGGFIGNETKRSQRASYPNLNTATRTILSGDIDNNDKQSNLTPAGIVGSNSGNLIRFNDTTSFGNAVVIDGFTFMRADGLNGSAISCLTSGKKICSPTIRNNHFITNRASSRGGAIFLVSQGQPLLQTSTSKPMIINNQFMNNYADSGGAILVHAMDGNAYDVLINGNSFIGNRADYGGAVGAEDRRGQININFYNNTWTANEAIAYGGALYAGSETITYTFDYNTFTQNTASRGGVTYNAPGVSGSFHHSIFWNNSAPLGHINYAHPGALGTFGIHDSLLQSQGCNYGGTTLNACPGSGQLLDINPQLDVLLYRGWQTLSMKLKNGSPAIDRSATNSCTLTKDQHGLKRPQGNGCDWGAVESADLYHLYTMITGMDNGQTIAISSSDDTFVFANGFANLGRVYPSGSTYNIRVERQPAGKTCIVGNGSGTVNTNHISNIFINCTKTVAPEYRIGGQLSGLASGQSIVLQNGTEQLPLIQNGTFNFVTQQKAGTAYAVSIKTSPSGQACTVSNGSGTVSTANVTNIQVKCQVKPKPGRIFSDSFE